MSSVLGHRIVRELCVYPRALWPSISRDSRPDRTTVETEGRYHGKLSQSTMIMPCVCGQNGSWFRLPFQCMARQSTHRLPGRTRPDHEELRSCTVACATSESREVPCIRNITRQEMSAHRMRNTVLMRKPYTQMLSLSALNATLRRSDHQYGKMGRQSSIVYSAYQHVRPHIPVSDG